MNNFGPTIRTINGETRELSGRPRGRRRPPSADGEEIEDDNEDDDDWVRSRGG
jgi:hypothetical protein